MASATRPTSGLAVTPDQPSLPPHSSASVSPARGCALRREAFFVAETYHHNYAEFNPGQPYIQFVSMPKVGKLVNYFGDKLKD